MDAKAAPNQGSGGGGGKKKRRKRGGGAGPHVIANSIPKDGSGRGGGKGGNKQKRRGGGAGRGGGGGDFSRFNPNAASPLQLPHFKVTLRNIRDASKNGSVEELVNSVRDFLEGAFPSDVAEDSESSPYTIAWKMEKEGFESAKSIFAEAAASGGSGGLASSSGRAFSSGWLYEEKPSPLPSGRWGRFSLLPGVGEVVTNLMDNATNVKVTKSTNINFIVDTAMSQMMQECGKKYLNFVGGQIVFDEVSAMDVVLAEKFQSEKKLVEEEMAQIIAKEENVSPDQPTTTENVNSEKQEETASVEAVTKGIEKLCTSDKALFAKQKALGQMPAIRVRILSATKVKNSKRRGEIAGKVQLALYPPDPCVLFQETCREAGKMAAENHVKNIAKAVTESGVDGNLETKGNTEVEDGKVTYSKGANSKPHPSVKKVTVPQIPYHPFLSPAERSRAVARSRVLLRRSIEAMKVHAAAQSTNSLEKGVHTWEVLESSSQKTWKGRPNPIIEPIMAGTALRDLVVEHKSGKSGVGAGGAAAKKGRKGGFHGDSRGDRYDSTIENTEDYKGFMESLKDGSNPSDAPANKEASADAKKNGNSNSLETEPPLDDQGRPLAAIVMHLREKQAEAAKAKAEMAAAQAKARAAAAAAKEKIRKDKQLKMKKEKSKKRKKEAARSTKSSSRASSSHPVIKAKPPVKASVPVSGFEVR